MCIAQDSFNDKTDLLPFRIPPLPPPSSLSPTGSLGNPNVFDIERKKKVVVVFRKGFCFAKCRDIIVSQRTERFSFNERREDVTGRNMKRYGWSVKVRISL